MRRLQIHHHRRPVDRGFTLVELLVVITIIGVLVALLVVALGAARTRVQEAAIKTEISGMGQALKSFTTQFSTDYPPDFSRGNPGDREAEINRFLARIFRYRTQTKMDGKFVGSGTDVPRWTDLSNNAASLDNLDPSEALVLWLRGFTVDPQNPLFGPNATTPEPRRPKDATQVLPLLPDRTPLFEFDRLRLRDDDGDGFYEYYPRFGAQQPYVYYANHTYVTNFRSPGPPWYKFNKASSGLPGPRPYLLATQAPPPADPTLLNKANFAGADDFQIIACGLDGEFGTPVDNSNYQSFAFPTGPYPDKLHRDNITSFAEGTLESSMP